LSAVGLLAYAVSPLARVRAKGAGAAGCAHANNLNSISVRPEAVPSAPAAELTDATFQVRSYGGKCLSFGAPLQASVGAQKQAGCKEPEKPKCLPLR